MFGFSWSNHPPAVIELGHPLAANTPISASHTPFTLALKRRHGDVMREDGGSGASEMIVMSPHSGTHIDAFCHASFEGKLFGGVDAAEAQKTAGGFRELGAETIPPMFCRGVLLDIPKVRGKLEPGYGVTAEDIELAAAGIEFQQGDVVLIRTGWGKYWADKETYMGHATGVPGIGLAAAELLVKHKPLAVGADTMAVEQITAETGHRNLPVHSLLLVKHGVYIIENMNLDALAASGHQEFLFVLAPLPIVGATGSPVRPLAVISQDA